MSTDGNKKPQEVINVEKITPKYLAQRCPVCNGFGTLKYGAKVCQGCKGKGYVLVPNCDPDKLGSEKDGKNENEDITY